ncbi:hypothetical protein [Lysobacter sp. 1R34A]|uniref:hypothetical protein n=1 Tax=Lysobacter sp. 1R34A TaxID=3445786 RepID=UPI003EEA7B23
MSEDMGFFFNTKRHSLTITQAQRLGTSIRQLEQRRSTPNKQFDIPRQHQGQHNA